MGKEIKDKDMTKKELLRRAIDLLRDTLAFDKSVQYCDCKMDSTLRTKIEQIINNYDCWGARYKRGKSVVVLDRSDFLPRTCKVTKIINNGPDLSPSYQVFSDIMRMDLGQYPEDQVFPTVKDCVAYWANRIDELNNEYGH